MGGVSRLPSKFGWLTVSKNFVREPFCVLKDFWFGKKFGDMRRYHDFPSKFFVSPCRKFRRGALLCSKTILVSKIFKQNRVGVRVRIRGGYHGFSKIFCLTVPKNFVWKISGMEKKFLGKKEWGGGGNGFFIFFVSLVRNEKLCKGNLLCFRNFLVWKEVYG